MTRYRCTNPHCSTFESFLPEAEIVEAFGGLHHAFNRQGALIDVAAVNTKVARIAPDPDPFPLPCGPVAAIEGPAGIRLRRLKGWRMPPNTINVARPTKWGNPWKIGEPHPYSGGLMTADDVVLVYRWHYTAHYGGLKPLDVRELRGKDLACHCALDEPCHRNVLLELANS